MIKNFNGIEQTVTLENGSSEVAQIFDRFIEVYGETFPTVCREFLHDIIYICTQIIDDDVDKYDMKVALAAVNECYQMFSKIKVVNLTNAK